MPEHQPPLQEFFPTLKSTTVAKALATLVGLCGAGLLVSGAGLGLYHLLDSTRPRPELQGFLFLGGLSIIGAILMVTAFRTFARPTPAVLRRLCGVIGVLLFLLLYGVGHLMLAPLLGDWGGVLAIVVALVVAVFLHDRIASFLAEEASLNHEKPSALRVGGERVRPPLAFRAGQKLRRILNSVLERKTR